MKPFLKVPTTFQPVDDVVDEAWDAIRGNAIADRIFYTASEAANFSMIWHALGIARAVAHGDLRAALKPSAALAIESALVNGPIKSMFERERPEAIAEDRPMRLRQPKTSSFPSGHASAAVVASSYLTRGSHWPWKLFVRSTAAIVATSRIHVKIHHATDVVAGAATGWVLARAMRPLLRRLFD